MMKSLQRPDGVTRFFFSPALSLAFCVFVTAILMTWYRSALLEQLMPFFEPILEIAGLLFFLVSVAVSLGHMIWARKQGSAAALSPFLLNLVTVLIVFFIPFASLEFHAHHRTRMEVVSAVLNGKYEGLIRVPGGRGDFVELPPRLSDLSRGGDVMVWHRQDATLIFFFHYRGILDSFSGFVYSSNDSPPRQGDFGGRFVEIERLQPNWFWATSTN